MNRRRTLRGFTLVELMVVVLIIAILAALVVPRIIGNADQARLTKAKADLAVLAGFVQNFRVDCSRFPTTDEGLASLESAPSDVQGKWKGPYPDKPIPNDPWDHPYHYTYPGQNGSDSFDLYSDGPPGGPAIYYGQTTS